MKKPIFWIAIIIFFTVQTSYADFPDVPADHANSPAISWLFNEGIIQGYPDGTFKPDSSVNRAELMKMVVTMKAAVDDNYNNCFPDVADDWYARYVCYANEQRWIQGYPDGTFKPENPINRAEAVKIILNASISPENWPHLTAMEKITTLHPDIDINAWYREYLQIAIAKNYIDASSGENYNPGEQMSRHEVAEMIYRIQSQ